MVSRAAHLAWLLVLLGWSAAARAQYLPPSAQTASSGQMPPLLYVKLTGPKGMQVTFVRGASPDQTFAAPCTIGIRPGYSVRMAITGIADYPNAAFFPTLEVRGSLFLANQMRSAEFPAALVFRAEDFTRVKADTAIKKIIVLERPDSAVPVATSTDDPFEIAVPANRDPLREARERGQPLLVMHLGERQFTRDELVNAPGTILLPGENVLCAPALPPWVEWHCFPVIDPRAGPISPAEFMCVPDGGDVGLPAGFDRQGKLRGLDPSDTVAEYFDSLGRRRLAVSNRVCLCIPRFIVVMTETAIANQVALMGPGAIKSGSGPGDIKSAQPTLEHHQKLQLEHVGSNQRASGTLQTLGTSVTGRIDNLVVASTIHGVQSMDAACLPSIPESKDGPLLIIKWPDRYGALVGDIVTFTLKYTNSGGRPITNIVVSDSLTTRFEYVPGTSKTDREAIFTTQPNEAGSQVLRWEIPGSLQPRESGIVTFQVRVR
jgi:uncharacterized repeat protein (TIGR01451 family)